MENMRYLLSGIDADKPAYLGYQLEPAWFDSPYMSGGAGYVFSRGGLKMLIERGINVKGTCEVRNKYYIISRFKKVKDAMPVSFRSELFTSYILTIFKQRNILP